MKITGLVAGVRDGSYVSAKTKETVVQTNVDIYDDTAGIQPCQMKPNGLMPVPGQRVSCDVLQVRKINFGVGYVHVIANVTQLPPLPPLDAFVPSLPPPPLSPKK